MALLITPESPMGIELAKWNKPYVYHPFPKMLYRAQKRPDGVISVGEAEDSILGGQAGAAEAFSKRCQIVVESEAEMRDAVERGWRAHPKEALDYFEEKAKSIADAAAHRAYEDRNMGEAAQAEAKKVEAATEEHVAEVPEAPKAKRKYTRRTAA